MSETIHKFSPLEPSLACTPYTQIQRIFVYFLQSLFEHEEFRSTGMWWNSNEDVTEMIISSEKPRVENLEKRPHISVIVGASAGHGLGFDQLQTRRMAREERTHTDLNSLTINYHCQGKEGNLCRTIAHYASFYTTVFRRMIMRQGKLFQVGPAHQVSAETGPTAFMGPLTSEELVSVVVSIPVYWQTQWFIREPRDVLSAAKTNLRVRGHRTKPFSVKGKPAYSIPINQFKSFEEASEAANPSPVFTQVVIHSED